MKKILSLILAVATLVSALSLTSCMVHPEKDWENVQKNGKFIVGCTEFDPMNYYENDQLVGFDTEYAQAVAAYLGVEVEFRMITWSQKYMELNGGKIDCIWNGFTSNSSDNGVARSESVRFTTGYATNYQCIVMKEGTVFTSVADLAGKTCAVEGGSAGEAYAITVTDEDNVVAKDAQIDAFTELKAGTVDFIVVDVLLANRTCGNGDFTDCNIVYEKTDDVELYAIGCRIGSTLAAKIDEATEALMNDGTLEALAAKYGVPLSAEVLELKNAE